MQFTGKTVPKSKIRNGDVGDWRLPRCDRIEVLSAQLGDRRSEFLVALHELIEAFLCELAGVTDDVVTAWDAAHMDSDDPGSMRGCPYHRQHMVALGIERIVCHAARMKWKDHEARITKASGRSFSTRHV